MEFHLFTAGEKDDHLVVFFKLQEKQEKSHMTISTDLSQFPDHYKIYVASTSGDTLIRERIMEFDTKC